MNITYCNAYNFNIIVLILRNLLREGNAFFGGLFGQTNFDHCIGFILAPARENKIGVVVNADLCWYANPTVVNN